MPKSYRVTLNTEERISLALALRYTIERCDKYAAGLNFYAQESTNLRDAYRKIMRYEYTSSDHS